MKISETVINAKIRSEIFEYLMGYEEKPYEINFQKINDRQYGCIVEDMEGNRRYARIAVIVAEKREDMTADELMESEINAYQTKQREKEQRKQERAEKAKRDKERREKEKAKKEEEKG